MHRGSSMFVVRRMVAPLGKKTRSWSASSVVITYRSVSDVEEKYELSSVLNLRCNLYRSTPVKHCIKGALVYTYHALEQPARHGESYCKLLMDAAMDGTSSSFVSLDDYLCWPGAAMSFRVTSESVEGFITKMMFKLIIMSTVTVYFWSQNIVKSTAFKQFEIQQVNHKTNGIM